jgi:hypothetical protein
MNYDINFSLCYHQKPSRGANEQKNVTRKVFISMYTKIHLINKTFSRQIYGEMQMRMCRVEKVQCEAVG